MLVCAVIIRFLKAYILRKFKRFEINSALIGTGGNIVSLTLVLLRFCNIKYVYSKSLRRLWVFKVFKIKVINNLNEILNDKLIKFVVINTESSAHYEYAKQALESGKHVLIEKPITLSLEEADKLNELAKKNNLLIGGIMQYRFLRAYRAAKKAINDNIIGEVIYSSCYVCLCRPKEHYVRGRGSLKADGGGVLMIQGFHFLDLMVDLVGDIEQCNSVKRNFIHKIEGEDTFLSFIKFQKGIGTLVVTTAVNKSLPMAIEIIGTRGKIIFNSKNEIITNNRKTTYLFQDILFDQVKDYFKALKSEIIPEVSYLHVRKSLENVLRLYRN